ncbi:MAG: 50S ribosomal protein L13 [Eubacteriales bacterium]|jgi:large subunit ribosomal protein L13|nr:50S ribosomal protein L13 [Eubacteriales bacterium]
MSTFIAKANELERQWYIIDAAGKPLGRVASVAASILRGKHKPTYTPNVDCGDYVIIINSDKAVLTGKKLDQKVWYRHSGYPGGLKATKYRTLMATRSDKAMELAVWGMLPHNSLGRAAMRKVRIYKDDNHNHQAQNPQAWTREIK